MALLLVKKRLMINQELGFKQLWGPCRVHSEIGY